MALTTKHIDDHTLGVHTEESFARAIIEQALQGAREQVAAAGEKEVVDVETKIQVSEFGVIGRIRICIIINGRRICFRPKI